MKFITPKEIQTNFRYSIVNFIGISKLSLVIFLKLFSILLERFLPLRGRGLNLKTTTLIDKIDLDRQRSIKRKDVVEVALMAILSRKARAMFTIGGMMIGIATIVLLVSIGFGLQKMVISRVAGLNELRQANIVTQAGSKLKITDKTIADIKQIESVKSIIPVISVIGKVSYQKSINDLPVYGVTADYIKESSIKLTAGKIFDSNNLEITEQIASPTAVLVVEEKPSSISGVVKVKDGWVEIGSESVDNTVPKTMTIDISSSAIKEAVVNRAALRSLSLNEEEAVGKFLAISFIVPGNLLTSETGGLVTSTAQYKIVGVVSDDKAPAILVPFVDLRTLGIVNYSQARATVMKESDLPNARHEIESLGYSTKSVADTVAQISKIFATVRFFLLLLGIVALFIAAIGMFNTLTVSLLERTREVGLMKSMGMKSYEVKELFLTESIIMGVSGGVLGVILGSAIGKVLELSLSIISQAKGAGYITVSSTPFSLVLSIIILSIVVSLITGIYPSKRATKISALDALRYE